MPRSSLRLVFTSRYVRSLARLAEGFDEATRFDAFVASLDARCKRLQRLPGLGRPVAPQPGGSASLRAEFERIQKAVPGSELRELVVGEYLLLYLVDAESVTLAGLRHQREAGYERSDD